MKKQLAPLGLLLFAGGYITGVVTYWTVTDLSLYKTISGCALTAVMCGASLLLEDLRRPL